MRRPHAGYNGESGRFLAVSCQRRRRVKAAAKATGPSDDFSGHSGRVGLVYRMAGKRAPTVTGYELRV